MGSSARNGTVGAESNFLGVKEKGADGDLPFSVASTGSGQLTGNRSLMLL